MELDKDLSARQEARTLCLQAETASSALRGMTQQQLDVIVEAMANAFCQQSAPLARMAVQETGFGNEADKTAKNRFASQDVLQAIRDMKTVGVLQEDQDRKLWQIGVPVGVIAAIVPSTNPTSTVCYKALIALKAGNAIVFSPHPKALQCTLAAVQVVSQAARAAGAPEGCISCLTLGQMAGTQELMSCPQVNLILATGGPGMVKAAYSSGKPAIGVGAGNGPAYLHRSCDLQQALRQILRSKTFDNGTVCASEQSIVVERDQLEAMQTAAEHLGYYFMSTEEAKKLASLLFKGNGSLSPQVVGKSAMTLAKLAGLTVPAGTQILVARSEGVGIQYPYSMEKLCPVLGLFVEDSQEAVLQRSLEVLHHEGRGHTFSIHAQDEAVIRRFALQMPVSRFLVNTPAALGGIGQSTALFPALTLGCGAVGGSASSNNISPMDLINIRRVAWDLGKQERTPSVDAGLVELLTAKILEKLR